jgi:hypothetical protein
MKPEVHAEALRAASRVAFSLAFVAGVLGRAKFRPPKGGYGLVSVPLKLFAAR